MITRSFLKDNLIIGLNRLVKQGFLERQNDSYSFTAIGLTKGKRTTKLHRLWELYLTNYMNIAPDHVHEDAETIEHIITPELEAKLEAFLKYPKIDPHNSEIPYSE
jgi:manganese/zinc/iron transport system permease protein